jgi:hypothetical protein
VYVRLVAISLSCMVAVLTLFNLLTVVTHGIEIEVPGDDGFAWAVDPVEQRVLIITNFTVKNHGAYDIDEINVNARLGTDSGIVLLDFSMSELTVSRGSDRRFDVMIPIELDDINISDWFPLLYEDTTFKLELDIDADYMYRLVRVTVDETLTYNWTAPLSGGVHDDLVLPGISSILELAQKGVGPFGKEVGTAIIEYAMTIHDFEIQNEDYGIWVNSSWSFDNLKNISCEVNLPFDDYGRLDVCFTVEVGLPEGTPYVDLKEVWLSYVAD